LFAALIHSFLCRTLSLGCFQEFEATLEEEEARLAQLVTGYFASRGLGQLKFIMDIPRLFRRTNREDPTKPSSYIQLSLTPIVEFNAKYEGIVNRQRMKAWLSAISLAMAKQ
jgi:hypothetical protein